MKSEIKFCPNCQGPLTESKKLSQGVKECKACKTNFFILITSSQNQ